MWADEVLMRGQHSVEIHFPCWPVSTIITSAADTADADPVKAESESAGTTLKAGASNDHGVGWSESESGSQQSICLSLNTIFWTIRIIFGWFCLPCSV